MENVHSDFEIGDVVVCIHGGGNNTSLGRFETAYTKDGKEYVVKTLLFKNSRHLAKNIEGTSGKVICTMETECGKYLWASKKYYKKVGTVEKGPISDYSIF